MVAGIWMSRCRGDRDGKGEAAGPDDVAGPIEMLLDPMSRAMTGEVVLLDGGGHLDVALSRRPGREG